jgi:YD repeat-containing protein
VYLFIRDTAPGGASLASFTYARNINSQLASTAPTGTTQSNETYSYTQLNQFVGVNTASHGYDAANQATRYTPANGSALAFTYDQRGNRITGTATRGAAASYSYDEANR